MTPILFGREPTGELRGTLRGGTFKGMRYGPGGQERERFEFSEEFPAMSGYSANVRCEARDGAYASTLSYVAEAGKIKSLEWRSTLTLRHTCTIAAGEQRRSRRTAVRRRTSQRQPRDLGDYVRVAAENCTALAAASLSRGAMSIRRGAAASCAPETR
jgi:hypothetical protein